MLDDLKLIHERDQADALGTAEKQYTQLSAQIVVDPLDFKPENIVFAAMGGSALAAHLSTTWPAYTVPFEIVRGYDLPAYVSNKTLVIASSNSGNTEETLSALTQAEAKGAKIAVITAGGQLQQIAEQKQYPLARIPKVPGRFASLYGLKLLLTLLQDSKVLAVDNALAQLESCAPFLQAAVAAWRADVPTASNQAKQIAQELMGRSVVMYSGPKLFPAAYKWKIGCNENAKQVAWANQLPEFNHNEFTGWSKQPVDKPYAIVELHASQEHPRIQQRFEVSERLLSGMRPEPIAVDVQGKTLLEQLLWAATLGDFVTLYLAFVSNVNPTPLELVDKLKAALSQ